MIPTPIFKKNDKKANWLIGIVSAVIIIVVASLSRIHPPKFPFDFSVHIFALINAIINSAVTILLVLGLWSVKQKKFTLHKNVMMTALLLSILFLVFYIAHHIFAGDTKFGDINHDGTLSDVEKAAVGSVRYLYFFILATHIALVTILLPFILFTAYRALIGEYTRHKKLARYTWPLWLYITVTGVVVYCMIKPYYGF